MTFEQAGYKEQNDGYQGASSGNSQSYQGGQGNGGGYGGAPRGNGNYGGGGGNGGGNRGGGGWSGGKSFGGGGGGNFARKPEGPPHIYKPYVIFGGEKTPQDVLEKFARIAKLLEDHGYTLRVGGLKGAEVFVEDKVKRLEVLLPWKGFDNRQSPHSWTPENAKIIAEKFEPGWSQLKPVIQTFLAKNVQKVYGHKLDSPALFVVMWSEDGVEHYRDRQQRSGSGGHISALASTARIPVYNFGNGNAEQRLMTYLDNLKDVVTMEGNYTQPSQQPQYQQPAQQPQQQFQPQEPVQTPMPASVTDEDIGF